MSRFVPQPDIPDPMVTAAWARDAASLPARISCFTMEVARSALLCLRLPLGEGRGVGYGHGERRLSSSGVALVALAVSRSP